MSNRDVHQKTMGNYKSCTKINGELLIILFDCGYSQSFLHSTVYKKIVGSRAKYVTVEEENGVEYSEFDFEDDSFFFKTISLSKDMGKRLIKNIRRIIN